MRFSGSWPKRKTPWQWCQTKRTEDRLLTELSAGEKLRTPVSIIYHGIDEVNEKLKLGRYFFMDIVREGIVLFEEPGHPFAEPRPLTPEQALQETRDYFEEWFESAREFLDDYQSNLERSRLKKAAFELHQAAERFYPRLLLVRTLHTPLCRARHKGLYAERRTMPNGFGLSRFPNALAAIGAA